MPWFTILIFFFSFNSDSVKASAYDLFIEASSLENQGKYEEAIKVYQKAIEYDPSSTELYRNIARLYTRLKKYKEALHYAHKALKIAPEDVENIKLTGTIYLQKLDINKGIKYFEMAQTLMPDDEEIMINLSYLYEGMNLFHKAEELLERITKTNPSLESYFRLGQISARMNNHSKALKYYYKALEFDSNSVPVLVGIGASYDFIDKPDSALIFYQIASTLDTANLNLKKRLVDLYTKLDRFDDLIDLCYEILRKNPFEFEVRRNLGYALYKNNRKLQALEQFLIGVGMNPKDSYGLFQAARIYVDLGQLTMALATIKDALKINPDNPDLLTYLGFIYLDLKKNAEADATFKRAIIKGGDRAQLYYLLGITATLRRDLKTAYQYYQKAIEVNS
ncbi:MAG: tetratricopeptide repeat protein, partial [candidate division WOR-3 bacterium]